MTFIRIGNVLSFSWNNGVMLEKGSLDVSAEELQKAVITAFSELRDERLIEACTSPHFSQGVSA